MRRRYAGDVRNWISLWIVGGIGDQLLDHAFDLEDLRVPGLDLDQDLPRIQRRLLRDERVRRRR